MTTINLKDFYSWYVTDEYMEVSDEVAEVLLASKRAEAAYAEWVRYHALSDTTRRYCFILHILEQGVIRFYAYQQNTTTG